ncbi:sensor histidine kinase [Cohnella thailandensis]|uniref:Sensor histidine kinase n=1 Tax=Cohnella thailandensis TaxID=557557 RepID=A0A841T0N4_9BACL|nr:histidine kinase [Cohnella thailandensis]MBB6634611.1 sensor histidine kinase [Cohnella thailandensis]MBP1972833.1 two-component system sensor histidine kinase YesM [Cohnella thailandensis]
MKTSKFRFSLRIRTIRNRFLVAMILWALPAILLLGYTSYNISKATVMDMNEKSNRDRLRTSSEIADLLFRNINGLHFSIVVNDAIRGDLIAKSEEDSFSRSENRQAGTSAILQRMISNSSADTKYVTSICLFDLRLRVACSGRSDDAGRYEGPDRDQSIRESDWYLDAYDSKGKVIYYPTDIFGDSESSFSTIKLFRDKSATDGEPIGILVINVSKTIFSKVFGNDGEYGSYMSLDERQGVTQAVFGDSGLLPENGSLGRTISSLRKQGYLVGFYDNQTTGWTFLHLVRSSELLRQSRNIPWVTTAIAVAFAAVALAISYLISRTVTKPLLKLKKMMLDWTKGTRDFPVMFGNDEVGVIGETFKRIVRHNEELSARLIRSELKEREAELRALQSQIKPHFLYNTLDSIYWMAVLDDNDQIADMAESLSVSFKLSLNKGRDSIAVRDELLHIRHYIRIQNLRFENRFRYVEEVEDSMLDCEIMKLLLQPLVENAIFHGLEPKLGEGTIWLKGVREGEDLLLTVEDDGVGMESLSVTEHGYGLRNVKERLRLAYGERSMLEIWSQPGAGTRIAVRFQPSNLKNTTDT